MFESLRSGHGLRRRVPLGFPAVVAALVLLIVAFHLVTTPLGAGWQSDGYQYLLHAENVVRGRPYADTGYIQNPERYIAPVAYPAGFPVLLALAIGLFGTSVQTIFVLMTLVLAASVAALAYLFRYELSPRYLFGLILAVGLQPYLWELKQAPLSDLPFLLGVVLSLLGYERSVRAERAGADTTRRWRLLAVLAGGAAAYAMGTRPLGLLLVPCFLVYDLVRVRRLTRPFIVAAASCVAVYGIWVVTFDLHAGARVVQEGAEAATNGEGGGYIALVRIAILDNLRELPRHVVDNVVDYARATFVLWDVPQPGGGVLKNILMALSLIPAGLGMAHRLRHHFGIVESFCLLYALALLPWSFSDVRYALPLIPFYYFYLFVGLEWLHRARRAAVRRSARVVTVATVVALVAVYSARYGNALLGDGPAPPSFEELADEAVYVYLREETAAADVVVTSGDPRRHIFFSRRAMAAGPRDLYRWATFADHLGATYALIGRDEGGAARELPGSRFQLVESSDSFDLYRVEPLNTPSPRGGSTSEP